MCFLPIMKSPFLFQLAADAFDTSANGDVMLSLFDAPLPFDYRFWVASSLGFDKQPSGTSRSHSPVPPCPETDFVTTETDMEEQCTMLCTFLEEQYGPDNLSELQRGSIRDCVHRDQCLLVTAFCGGSQKDYALDLIQNPSPDFALERNRSSTPNGVWIDWLAVSKGAYYSNVFGRYGSGSPFCRIGIGSLLLTALQLQNSAMGWSTSLYLQSLPHSMACQTFLRKNHFDEVRAGEGKNMSFKLSRDETRFGGSGLRSAPW